MTVQLIVLEVAEEELADAETWYESQRPGLGSVFLSSVTHAMDRILTRPLGAVVAPGTPPELGALCIRVRKFPYSVVFYRDGDIV